MDRRATVLGLLLIGAAGSTALSDPATVADGFTAAALVCCALAGGSYLVGGTGAGLGVEIGGRELTLDRYRAAGQILVGIGIVSVGVGGSLGSGYFGTFLAALGALSVVVGAFHWREPADD